MSSQIQNASGLFTTVRYYTAADPYYYTVDNRPLTDCATNDGVLAQGIDSSRMISSSLNLAYGYLTGMSSSPYAKAVGLRPYKDASNNWYLSPGVFSIPASVNSSIVPTFGVNQSAQALTIVPCITAGNFKTHTVFASLVTASSSNVTSVPFYDSGNTFIQTDGVMKQLLISVVESAEMTQPGTPVLPTTPSTPTNGTAYIPLYQIITYGAETVYYVRPISGTALGYDYLSFSSDSYVAGENPATASNYGGRPAYSMAASVYTEVNYILRPGVNFIPGTDINLRLDFVQPGASGNNKLKISYAVVTDGGTVSATPTYTDVVYNLPNCNAGAMDSRIIPCYIKGSSNTSANYVVLKVGRMANDAYTSTAVAAQPFYLMDVSTVL